MQGRLTRDVFPPESRERDAASARWHFVHPGPGGESFAMLHARVCAWLASVRQDTVVTAHGGVMRCVRRYFEGHDDAAIFALDAPQDKVLIIQGGSVRWL